MRRDDTNSVPTDSTVTMPTHNEMLLPQTSSNQTEQNNDTSNLRRGYDANFDLRSPDTALCTDCGEEDGDSMINKTQHEQITNVAPARFNVVASTDTSVYIEFSTNLSDPANKYSGVLAHMNQNHNCNKSKPQRTPAGGMVDPCRAEYRYKRSLKKDTSVCGTDSRSVMGIMSVLVIIILGLASGVVYFLFQGESNSEAASASDLPATPDLSSLVNQTITCGKRPPNYLYSSIRARLTATTQVNSFQSTVPDGSHNNTAQRKKPHSNVSIPFSNNGALPIAGRIFGGQSVVISRFPWQVSLWAPKTNARMKCGGALITPKWVVTAAHCIHKHPDANEWTLYMGLSRMSDRYKSSVQSFDADCAVVHPDYRTAFHFQYDYDIGLLRLVTEARYSYTVKPVCLPSVQREFADGMSCFVSGWGATLNSGRMNAPDLLQYAEIKIVGHATCGQMDWLGPLVTDRMICAGEADGSKDACQGDSGGPLSCFDNDVGAWTLAGIVSWGKGCGQPKAPGVYTKISVFTDWIWTTIANRSNCHKA